MEVLHSLFKIPFSKQSYHIETSLTIYIANQLPSFYMRGIEEDWEEYDSLLRGIFEQTLFSNKNCAKDIHLIFRFLNIIY